ncbi:MAG: putative oxidoreductase YcjS [Firmicutes bacterium ADurb.Bin262]|nr:MAG: putative oxidoreductase YcjS [Firmicutes bacterium ADurb.Bin262]
MKIAIVGCGGISKVHLQCIASIPDAKLIAAADIDFPRAQRAAQAYDAAAYASLDELLAAEKPDILHICTPHYLHVPMALAAAERGIHVLIEKPCAISVDGATTLVEAQKKTGVAMGVCFQNRYNRSARYLKSLVSGQTPYGRLEGVRGFVCWQRDEDYYADDWHGSLEKEGGGVLMNQAIHTVDMLGFLAGDFQAVSGSIANYHLKGVIEVEDTASALFEFPGGVKGLLYATTAYSANAPVFVELQFEHAALRMEEDNLYELSGGQTLRQLTDFEKLDCFGKDCWGTGHNALINDFYACVRSGERFSIDPAEGGKAVGAVLGIYRSSATGEKQRL